MPYTIEIGGPAFDELQAIKPFYRRRIANTIDQQLMHEPSVETRNRKILTGLQPDFEHDEPVWELRVGQHRVYYEVNQESKTVVVRAVREKPPHATREEIT